MSDLQLMRLRIVPPALMRFAQAQGLLRHDDEGLGYLLHAWLAAMFGQHAPQPFRYLEPRNELLGYSRSDGTAIADHAQAFASPSAWAALQPQSLATKPMPRTWRTGQRLRTEVLACPVSRKDDREKDVYLRALDRFGERAPPRAEVYLDWFRRQWGDAADIESVELAGIARRRLLRKAHAVGGGRAAQTIERPQALFRAVLRIAEPAAFADKLARGIGRHRAFGFGMPLLSPPP